VLAAAPAGQLAEAAEMMDRIRLIGIDRSASCGPGGATSLAPADGGACPNGAHPNGAHANGAHRNGPDPNSAHPHGSHPYAAHPDTAQPDTAQPDTADKESTSRDRAHPAGKRAAKTAGGQARRPVPLAIQEAIATRHVLLIDYRDRQGVVTAREVEPVALAGTQAHWYLMGWCRLRNAARAFRMDRIVAAVDTGEPAPHRSYADLNVDIPHALVRVPDLAG